MTTLAHDLLVQQELEIPSPIWCFVTKSNKKKKESEEVKEETKEKEEKYILCRQCENKITLPEQRIEVAGEFEHTFLNPGGQVFHIGCFQSAEGCISLGVPTSDWTWFEGFEWQAALCNQCHIHLGWFYRSMQEMNFFGLILNMLKA